MSDDPLAVLSVTVSEEDGGTRYRYELRTSGGTEFGALEQEYSLVVSQSLVRDLCEEIDGILKSALDASLGGTPSSGSDLRDELVRTGQTLYSQLFRPVKGTDEPALITKVRESQGPLMVRSNETLVPWELLHDGTDFLGLTHDLGQGSVVRTSPHPGREIGPVEKALIIGDPLEDLPAASHEAARVAEWFTARGAECTVLRGSKATLANVVRELTSTQYDLLHYCGHVTVRSDPAKSGLLLHQRRLLDEHALETAAVVGAPPVVFVNGCKAVGPVANLCLSFMTLGSKVVIGTRAEVGEESAKRFAETFYRELLDDKTAGSAMREARRAVLSEPDCAWASFLLYGNPSVHITGRNPAPARPRVQERGEYSPEAVELLDRVNAAAKGIVTSTDLLFGLVTCPELQPSMRRTIGSTNLAVLTATLYGVIGADVGVDARPGSTNGRAPDVQRSDSVEAALVKAKEIASADGRSMVTPQDIAAAYVETGGGSSARLLEIINVSLQQLLPPDSARAESQQAPTRTSSGLAAQCFDDDGRLRTDAFDDSAVRALRAALLLAAGRRTAIGSDTFLQGFGIAGSAVLRAALEKQGDVGKRAVRALSSPTPRRKHFSERSLTALGTAKPAATGAPADEVSLLLALLADEASGARKVLEGLGVDGVRLIEDLRRPDRE
ncbi:CHAT domain-containing protein [Saccharopolyspora sp. WRP15-2]|uniref:CHAT domain-containing protein n=1 Tax=Saccharopolyspora oryzae TaxID=2997343 RepID=A0ABT4UZE4_9PSEU|nr:CHAT domain-containing protein [Saccharopolyspora oryzae]MDA3627089.1 CHAT domain-containing protein [Saccharopolyspora oryzae]